MDIITFICGGTSVAILLTQLLKKWFDKNINEKYSNVTAQACLLFISMCIAGIAYCTNYLPEHVIVIGGIIFGAGMGIYDVFKAMGIATGLITKK